MTVRRQWLVITGVVSALAVALLITITRFGDELFPLAIGSRAPDFRATSIDGAPVAKGIADFAGEVVLLNLWATWCIPCRAEMPSMERLEKVLGGQGLRIVAVSIDNPGMEAAIRAFRDEFKLTFEILHDAPGAIRQQYQSTGVPETFVIGRDGRIRRRIIGADDWSSAANVAFLERLLAEPASR
ncbi:MAG: TlpA family protein disulfide reductase [Gemmatimonadota bacterium]|nr:TlpA family protein disulfide reductase [Gemmatimonadota bacterium]